MPAVTNRKRKAMALDTSEGCQKCGILYSSATLWRDEEKQRELCRTCKCAETKALSFQTPCGQHYCKRCGFLIESVVPNFCAPDYCSACFLIQDSYVRHDDFRKAAGSCKCDFCGNRHSPPPEQKVVKKNLKMTSKKFGKISQTQASLEENIDFVQMALSESDSDLDPVRKENQVEEEIRIKWERY